MREGWEYKKLGDLCDIYQPKTLATEQLVADGKYYVYGANGIIGRYNDYNHEQSEILLTCRGATCGTINISQPYSWINGNAMVIHRKSEDLSFDFLKYLMLSLDYSLIITGAAQPQITRQKIAPIIVKFPSLSVQQSIVSELDKINELISLKKEQLKDYDNLAQSIFYEMFGDPVENQKGWEERTMQDLCVNIVDCPHSTPKKVDYITDYPCIRTSELRGGSISWATMQYLDEDEYNIRIARLKPEAGDIVFGREGTIGDAVILPLGYNFSLGQRTMLLRADTSIVSNIFFHRIILSDWIKHQIEYVNVSSTVAHVNIRDFKKFTVPLPPLQLQQVFASRITQIEALKAEVQRTIKDLETLLASRMQYWFD